MWSSEKWAEIPLRSEQIREALKKSGFSPSSITNRKPIFEKPVDWERVESIVANVMGGGVSDDIKSNPVSSVEQNVEIPAPPAPVSEENAPAPHKKGRKRGRPKKH